MKTITWLVLCNQVQAQIYDISQHKHEIWESAPAATLIKTFEFPAGKMKGTDLVTDRAGHFKTRQTTRGNYMPHETPHENAIEHFAITLAHFLEDELAKKQFEHFILCAEPHFYGLLRQHFIKQLEQVMTRVIRKDYLPLDTSSLKQLIADVQRDTACESFDL